MNKFKIGDKVIINKEKDILCFLGDFFNQELEVTNIKHNDDKSLEIIEFKSLITNNKDEANSNWFELSPQRGDRVKIISHQGEKTNIDYFGEIGILEDVSYLDNYPYMVYINNEKYNINVFVKDVEICDSQIEKNLQWSANLINEPRNIGYKESEGKLSYADLQWKAIEEVAKVDNWGKIKYPRGNSKKVHDYTKLWDSAIRHLKSAIQKEDYDSQSNELHLSHAAWNILTLIECIKNNNINDDRL